MPIENIPSLFATPEPSYMKAVAKNDENETRIINTQKEETNGN